MERRARLPASWNGGLPLKQEPVGGRCPHLPHSVVGVRPRAPTETRQTGTSAAHEHVVILVRVPHSLLCVASVMKCTEIHKSELPTAELWGTDAVGLQNVTADAEDAHPKGWGTRLNKSGLTS